MVVESKKSLNPLKALVKATKVARETAGQMQQSLTLEKLTSAYSLILCNKVTSTTEAE